MMTFDEILRAMEQAALAERQIAREAGRKAELYEAQIAGMKQARDILRARNPDITEMPNKEMPDEQQQRRQRRDVRGMVLAALQEAKLGISTESLAEKLDITKAQAESALEHHAGKGNARGNIVDGMWFPAEPAAPTTKAVPSWAQPDGNADGQGVDLNHGSEFQPGQTPPAERTVVDIIRLAGATGMSDKELVDQGVPFLEVIKAVKAELIFHGEDKRYHIAQRGDSASPLHGAT